MRLRIEERDCLYVSFYDGEGFGLRLGQEWRKNRRSKKPTETCDADVFYAEHAVAKLADGIDRNSGGFYFESLAAARRALAAANAAIRAGRENRVLAEWEKTAIANGWKPPKGWTGPKTEKG